MDFLRDLLDEVTFKTGEEGETLDLTMKIWIKVQRDTASRVLEGKMWKELPEIRKLPKPENLFSVFHSYFLFKNFPGKYDL